MIQTLKRGVEVGPVKRFGTIERGRGSERRGKGGQCRLLPPPPHSFILKSLSESEVYSSTSSCCFFQLHREGTCVRVRMEVSLELHLLECAVAETIVSSPKFHNKKISCEVIKEPNLISRENSAGKVTIKSYKS